MLPTDSAVMLVIPIRDEELRGLRRLVFLLSEIVIGILGERLHSSNMQRCGLCNTQTIPVKRHGGTDGCTVAHQRACRCTHVDRQEEEALLPWAVLPVQVRVDQGSRACPHALARIVLFFLKVCLLQLLQTINPVGRSLRKGPVLSSCLIVFPNTVCAVSAIT